MNKFINIVPMICKINEENLSEVKFLNDHIFSANEKSTFSIGLFSSIFCDRDLQIRLLLTHIEKGIALDMGTVDIVQKESEELYLYTNTFFFNVETSFPEKGKYSLEVFLENKEDENYFFGTTEENSEKLKPIAVNVIEVN